jgi:outer membrane receptor for ferrienterochelin and colicins
MKPKIILLLLLITGQINVLAQSSEQLKNSIDSSTSNDLEEVTISTRTNPVKRDPQAIPKEIYSASFFLKNPTPSIFEALSMVNGVRPQLNCNVCNTGDIHINGMEGPYTLILIDGMPIVSALSTVYGLSGIPNSLVEKIEVVKGPTEAMYGSEAMGGMINIITRNPEKAPLFHVDIMGTSWQEINTDISIKAKPFKNAETLLGINYFNYQKPFDKNGDGFTDVTLQNRISIFNKWIFKRKQNRIASLAARYVYEDRWGGQMNWSKKWRGSDSIYGESIYTNRWEIIGQYQLPTRPKIMAQFSVIGHNQDSYYGRVSFQGNQKVAFAQLYWLTKWNEHSITTGASMRYTIYNDNTPATANEKGIDQPSRTPLSGLFAEDAWTLSKKHLLYIGYRLDYDPILHFIQSPRLAYKWSVSNNSSLRMSFGKGFRVVNIFTEDHAALTGARKVEITEKLKPEQSYNSNLNYSHTIIIGNGFINLDGLAFYSYFTNKIVGDFDTDPNKIIYKNLNGHAISKGLTINADATFSIPLNIRAGVNYLDVYQINKDEINNTIEKVQQLFAPKWSGNFSVGYTFPKQFSVDITGQINGPMRLPIQKDDYRPEYSPTFCTANIQITKKLKSNWEVYSGIKNLFNFVPKDTYMRPFDPFDKHVNDIATNPHGYTFDTEYNYAPLQGIRYFIGLRYTLKQ